MQKKISLLYEDGKAGQTSKSVMTAVYNLNIDRMTAAACASKRHTEYFLSVLCRECVSEKNALYRAEILKDFLRYPDLLSGLFQLFKGYENLPEETEEIINEIFRYGLPASASGMLDCTYEELYVNAHYARNVIAYFAEIYDLFAPYEVKSEGLKAMKEFCVSISNSRCITELENAAGCFKSENLSSYKFTLEAQVDDAMRLAACSITDVREANEKEKKSILGLFKKDSAVKVDIGGSSAENSASALTMAMSELSAVFASLAEGLYDVFKGIGAELAFYTVALDIEKYLKKSGMYCVFPEVLPPESDTLEASEIFDMLLINEGKGSADIVTNDVSLEKSILARGDNNCGKTSFLRSVGTAVLFAQNGLFVCARSMRVSVRSKIFTHFSSAEKDFEDGDAAGRFEGEVKEIAEIMKSVEPHSLVLLNETFQTTAYKEGALGMKDILDVLTAINSRYIFVTHMNAIFKLFEKGEASVLRAVGFKLKSENPMI